MLIPFMLPHLIRPEISAVIAAFPFAVRVRTVEDGSASGFLGMPVAVLLSPDPCPAGAPIVHTVVHELLG